MEFSFHLRFPCGSPSTDLSCQISAHQRQAETSENVNKHGKHVPRAMTSLLMQSPLISISHRLFRSGYSNSRDVVARSPSFSRPSTRALRRTCSKARTKSKQKRHYYISQLIRAHCYCHSHYVNFLAFYWFLKFPGRFVFSSSSSLIFFFGSTINTFVLQFPFSPSVLLVRLSHKHFRQYYYDDRSPYFSL